MSEPCPDCNHLIDEKHGAAGCSERVKNGNNTEFCQCRHDAATARRLAAGERLAWLVSLMYTAQSMDALAPDYDEQMKHAAEEILSYNHPTP